MKKIIMISLNLISFIIFFFIFSIFLTYFFLLKGIKIDKLNYQNINIGELYIKIDKKVILKGKNIKIVTKKSSSSTQINYDETTKLTKTIIQYLSYFQKISLQNIDINGNQINLLSFYNNKLKIDTNKFEVKSSIKIKQKSIEFIIYQAYFKPLNLKLKNVKVESTSNLFRLNLKISTIYKNSKIDLNLKLNKNKISYNGIIYNLTNNLIQNFLNLKNQQLSFKIKKTSFKGDLDKIEFELLETDLNYKAIPIYIDSINGDFTFKDSNLNTNLNLIKLEKTILIQNTNLKLNKNLLAEKASEK